MITPRVAMTILVVVSLCGLGPGCGGSNEGAGAGAGVEAEEIIKNLKALKPGEILIQGKRREKFSGPYTLQRGGYVMAFERDGGSGNLTVALESHRGSRKPPYQLLLADSGQKTGRREVTLSGKAYVHIKSTAAGYMLRFTPKADAR